MYVECTSIVRQLYGGYTATVHHSDTGTHDLRGPHGVRPQGGQEGLGQGWCTSIVRRLYVNCTATIRRVFITVILVLVIYVGTMVWDRREDNCMSVVQRMYGICKTVLLSFS